MTETDEAGNSIHLLPCPFCGFDNPRIRSNGIGDHFVICDGYDDEAWCGASSSDSHCETVGGAVARWNKRSDMPSTKPADAERQRDIYKAVASSERADRERVCSECYQAVGMLGEALGCLEDENFIRLQDMLAYGKTDDGKELLPFPLLPNPRADEAIKRAEGAEREIAEIEQALAYAGQLKLAGDDTSRAGRIRWLYDDYRQDIIGKLAVAQAALEYLSDNQQHNWARNNPGDTICAVQNIARAALKEIAP